MIFGVDATSNPKKFFSYSITPSTNTSSFVSNITSDCSSSKSWSSDDLVAASQYSCSCEKGGTACSQVGSYTTSTDSVCLVIHCGNELFGGTCTGNVQLEINDALSIKQSTTAIPWLWSTVRVSGTGFGTAISNYQASCKNSGEKDVSCAVKNVIDSQTLELSISSMLTFADNGALSVMVNYNDQQSSFVQIGVVGFSGISYYWKYIILFGLLIGMGVWLYLKTKKVESKEVGMQNHATVLTSAPGPYARGGNMVAPSYGMPVSNLNNMGGQSSPTPSFY